MASIGPLSDAGMGRPWILVVCFLVQQPEYFHVSWGEAAGRKNEEPEEREPKEKNEKKDKKEAHSQSSLLSHGHREMCFSLASALQKA